MTTLQCHDIYQPIVFITLSPEQRAMSKGSASMPTQIKTDF